MSAETSKNTQSLLSHVSTMLFESANEKKHILNSWLFSKITGVLGIAYVFVHFLFI